MPKYRCPNCGSALVGRGVGFTLATPRLLRKFRATHGICCFNCGYKSFFKRKWEVEDEQE